MYSTLTRLISSPEHLFANGMVKTTEFTATKKEMWKKYFCVSETNRTTKILHIGRRQGRKKKEKKKHGQSCNRFFLLLCSRNSCFFCCCYFCYILTVFYLYSFCFCPISNLTTTINIFYFPPHPPSIWLKLALEWEGQFQHN